MPTLASNSNVAGMAKRYPMIPFPAMSCQSSKWKQWSRNLFFAKVWTVPRNRHNTFIRKFIAVMLFHFLVFWRFPEIRIRHHAWMFASGRHSKGKYDVCQVFWMQFWECKIFAFVDFNLNEGKLEGKLRANWAFWICLISCIVIAFYYRKANIIRRWSNILSIFNGN